MANAQDFIGLGKRIAQDICENKSLIFRLVSVDGEIFLGLPEDLRNDRLCAIIENGKIVEATIQ